MSAGSPTETSIRRPLAIGVVGGLIGLKLSLHVAATAFGPYEFHRDEFLYMAMGEHLRLFTMDFPPFIAILSETTRGLLGDSLVTLRLPPALMSCVLLLLAALTARELGGGRFAQALASVCVLASPLFLRSGNLFQPVVIDQLWWTLALFGLVMLGRTGDRRWWIAFGVACGFGLLSKFSMLVFGFAVFLATLATPARRDLRSRWPWAAAVVAFAIGSPSFIGQIRLGWPLFDQMGDLRAGQLAQVTPLEFIGDQPLMGLGFIVAVVGVGALAFGRSWRSFRLVGWSCLMVFVTLLALKGKSYYLGPVYAVLYGAGAVVLERLRLPRWGTIARWATVAAVVGYGVITVPIGLPILSPPHLERYAIAIGLQRATETNVGGQERIPQDFADMLNWREQVEEVARVYHALPPGDRARAVLWASNYGEAGAIDYYGPRYGLPKARAFVGTYWFFGPGELPGEVIVFHGFGEDDFTDFCDTRTAAGYVTHPFAVSEQRDLTVYVCHGPRRTLQELWPGFEGER